MSFLVVYDDTIARSEIISDVIGEKGFSGVVVKRRTLESMFKDIIGRIYDGAETVTLLSVYEIDQLLSDIESGCSSGARVLHFFANFIIADEETASFTLKKLPFTDESYLLVQNGITAGIMFPDTASYLAYLRQTVKNYNRSSAVAAKTVTRSMPIEGVTYIGEIGNFIQCIAGNFDARYFNSLKGDEYTIVKTSSNKKKIKAEYTFYHLLPEDMSFWFVEPFNYTENADSASYTMERLHMTDLAIKWVHGSIDLSELSSILDKYFYFFSRRHSRDISPEEYIKTADSLYVKKVKDRIEDLKKLSAYEEIAKATALGTGLSVDELAEKYFSLKEKLEKNTSFRYVSVIGHGDPCFANTMYNKSTKTLKFIDPKGALTEEELWTDPYYDIAKLSHSVCGRYDFFNNALFDIRINSDFRAELQIDFDNSRHIELFRQKAEENGFDFRLVRLYEASLFLSMLPLHIDNPYKVLGFILNAENILKEIENNV